MKNITIEKMIAVETMIREMSVKIGIPVIIANGQQASTPKTVCVCLSACTPSETVSPLIINVNISDNALLERAAKIFNSMSKKLIEIVEKVCLQRKQTAFDEFIPTEEILDRWEKFEKWVKIHYPKYSKYSDRWLFESNHPENYVAYAARVILGGVKPGTYTAKLIREGKVVFGEDGYARLKKPISVYNFEHADPIDSVGAEGTKRLTGGAFECCFEHNSRIARCTKVPEQWELDEGIFVKFDVPKKKGLFK